MVPLVEAAAERRSIGANLYYGWVVLGVSALAMVGTLPGRTQGLGLITEPLLADLGVDRVRFAQINLVATLIGSLMCFGIGGLVDRRGSRIVLTTLALLLGGVVIAMASIESAAMLLVLITLTRGLGQSALSVVSLAMPGKWFRRRLTWAMGVFALVTSVGFMLAFPAVGALVLARGWRVAWAAIGVALIFGLAPLAWLFVRREPETNAELEAPAMAAQESTTADVTLGGALRSPAFWVFGLASSLYGLVASGIGLFNESILAERGFAPDVYYTALAITAITGLAGNFVAGAWADRVSLRHVLISALLLHGRRARRASSRQHHRTRDGPGGCDGPRRRLRDGRVLQLLGEGLRPHASGADPGRGAGADRVCVGRRSAAAGVVGRDDRIVRGRVLRPRRNVLGLLAAAALVVRDPRRPSPSLWPGT